MSVTFPIKTNGAWKVNLKCLLFSRRGAVVFRVLGALPRPEASGDLWQEPRTPHGYLLPGKALR